MKRNLQRFIDSRAAVVRSLEKTKKFYRRYDPGWYLYRKVASESSIAAKFTDEFIELVYVTLAAWNMNSRGAKLSEFDIFKESIYRNREYFTRLANYRLEQLSSTSLRELLVGDARTLFFNLELVADGKPRLVTYSKTFHFFLPDLFVPIDRRYTLTYFYKSEDVPNKLDMQFQRLSDILEECRRLATSIQLNRFLDNIWNANVPKTIDDIIIGYQK
jgi:hypothetical protein